MKLLYCGVYHDYGKADHGLDTNLICIADALRHIEGIELLTFHFDVLAHQGRDVNAEFLSLVSKEHPDVTLIVLTHDEFSPSALDQARAFTTLVSWGTDDHVTFRTGYMQRYAPHFDFCITTYKDSIADYLAAGQPKVIVNQWGCNHHFFHPSNDGYLYDVSFVGMNYGPRLDIVNYLWRKGIPVTVFGNRWPQTRRGWKRGWWFTLFGNDVPKPRWAEPAEMVEIYGRSKINLCINNNVTPVENIKGRNFEVPACRGFLLTGPAQYLDEYFEIGKEVVVYYDLDDLASKIEYYLEHDEEREAIAQAGYQRALRDHTYERRFAEIFRTISL